MHTHTYKILCERDCVCFSPKKFSSIPSKSCCSRISTDFSPKLLIITFTTTTPPTITTKSKKKKWISTQRYSKLISIPLPFIYYFNSNLTILKEQNRAKKKIVCVCLWIITREGKKIYCFEIFERESWCFETMRITNSSFNVTEKLDFFWLSYVIRMNEYKWKISEWKKNGLNWLTFDKFFCKM